MRQKIQNQPKPHKPGTMFAVTISAKISTPKTICAIANFIIHLRKCPGSLTPIAASISNIAAGSNIIPTLTMLNVLTRLITSMAKALIQMNISLRRGFLLLNIMARSPSSPIRAMRMIIVRMAQAHDSVTPIVNPHVCPSIVVVVPIVDSNSPPDKKLEALVLNHTKWQMSHLGISGIGQVECRNLPPKKLRAYINMRDEYEAIFRKVIKEGIAEGEFRSMDPKLASLFTLGFMNSIIQWFRANGELSSEEISSEAYKFVSYKLDTRPACKHR